ncbi:adenine deaminase [Enterococcus termitis]
MFEKINLFDDMVIDGHAPGLSGKKLQAYRMAGIYNDHESENGREAIEKLRAGFYLMIREGSGARNLEPIINSLLQNNIAIDRCMFCTDDKHLQDIEIEGHINYCVRKAIEFGLPIMKAYKMATYQPAQAYNLKNLGAIGAGYKADILIFDDIKSVKPVKVFCSGIDIDVLEAQFDYHQNLNEEITNTIKFDNINFSDIALKKNEKNYVIELVPNSLLTKLKYEPIPGNINFSPDKTYSKLCVVERYGKTNTIAVCPLRGYEIFQGAIACSISHDSHNIVVVGDNDNDIILATNELKRIQGGIVIVSKGQVVELLQLEIAGLMTDRPYNIVRKQLNKMLKVAKGLNISDGVDPFITLVFLSLTAIPEVRLIEKGLYDVVSETIIPES